MDTEKESMEQGMCMRVELSRKWIGIKGLVCGATMMILSLPLALYNVYLWIGVEAFAVLSGLVAFLHQRRERGVYTFYTDRITVEGRFDEDEEATVYNDLTLEDLRFSQGPVEKLLDVGKLRIRHGEASLYGISQFAKVRDFLEKHYRKKDGNEQ